MEIKRKYGQPLLAVAVVFFFVAMVGGFAACWVDGETGQSLEAQSILAFCCGGVSLLIFGFIHAK